MGHTITSLRPICVSKPPSHFMLQKSNTLAQAAGQRYITRYVLLDHLHSGPAILDMSSLFHLLFPPFSLQSPITHKYQYTSSQIDPSPDSPLPTPRFHHININPQLSLQQLTQPAPIPCINPIPPPTPFYLYIIIPLGPTHGATQPNLFVRRLFIQHICSMGGEIQG